MKRKLNRMGMRLNRVLRETEGTVAEYRRLAQVNPDAFEPYLAVALYNLGNLLSFLRRPDLATGEADELCRRGLRGWQLFVRQVRLGGDVVLEEALSSTELEGLGRGDPIQPVVQEYRRLAQADQAAFEPDLAMSLIDAGARDAERSVFVTALEFTGEAIEIAGRLEARGQTAEALRVREEAVPVTEKVTATHREMMGTVARWRLEAADSDMVNSLLWVTRLAMALMRLGAELSALGRRQEALAAAEEEVAVRRRLAHANPAAFGPDLAASLDALGARLSAVGRAEEAKAAAAEAIAICRRLALADPGAFEPGPDEPGGDLSALGRPEVALEVTARMFLDRTRAARGMAAAELDRAAALWGYARVQVGARADLDDGLQAIVESIRLYRSLAETRPEAFGAALDGATRTAADLLEGLGRREDALDVGRWLQSRGEPGSPGAPRS